MAANGQIFGGWNVSTRLEGTGRSRVSPINLDWRGAYAQGARQMSSVVSASYSVKSGIVPAIKLDKDRLHLISQPDGREGQLSTAFCLAVCQSAISTMQKSFASSRVERFRGSREEIQQVVRFSDFLGKQASDHPPIRSTMTETTVTAQVYARVLSSEHGITPFPTQSLTPEVMNKS